ncbi:hypothetical protein E4T39_06817 [Aureobasidium subglaciale]|nr:hypothetical protein E4T39_06817 [Aureobasidium subglaciale]
MSTHDIALMSLRTQIFDNWRYAHPNNSTVSILTTRRPGANGYMHEAAIVEDPGQSDKVSLKSDSHAFIEDALRDILGRVSEMVTPIMDSAIVEELAVKIPSNDDMEVKREEEKFKEVEKPKASNPATENMLTSEIRSSYYPMISKCMC